MADRLGVSYWLAFEGHHFTLIISPIINKTKRTIFGINLMQLIKPQISYTPKFLILMTPRGT